MKHIIIGLALVGLTIGGTIGLYLTYHYKIPSTAFPCNEGIHVTHNNIPIHDLAIKLVTNSGTLGSTNSTGYFILDFCQPIGALVTFQATDYGFQLEPHKIIEALL